MPFIVIAKRARDTLIIGENLPEDKAVKLARDSILQGAVSSAHVVEATASFFESSINRANPDTDTSLGGDADGEEKNNSLNATSAAVDGFEGEKGESQDRPEVTKAEALKLQEAPAKSTAAKAAAPKA